VCVPVCLAAVFLRTLGLQGGAKILFVESFCRVESLSVTGKLLYCLADRFVVHWPELLQKHPSAEYIGQIY
jgi:beta-1,4-N-acetylglucosaminyltransferase